MDDREKEIVRQARILAIEECAMTHDHRVFELRNAESSYKHGKMTKSAKRASDFHERSASAIRALKKAGTNDG